MAFKQKLPVVHSTVSAFLQHLKQQLKSGVLWLQYVIKYKNVQRWRQVINILVHLESKRNDNNPKWSLIPWQSYFVSFSLISNSYGLPELNPLLRLITLPLCSYSGKSVSPPQVCANSLIFTLWKPAHSFSMDEMSSQSDSVKLCRGTKAMQRLWDDSGMDGAMICGRYWIWLAISLGRKKGVRRVISAFSPLLSLSARLNIFASWGNVYTSKSLSPSQRPAHVGV